MSDFMLGEHAAMIRVLDERTAEMAEDIKDIKGMLSERRGERRAVTVGLGAVGGGSITLLFKLIAIKLGMHG